MPSLADDPEPLGWTEVASTASRNGLLDTIVDLSVSLGCDVSVTLRQEGSQRYLTISTGNLDPLDEDETSDVIADRLDR